MRGVVGLVPVSVKGELHPQPPDRYEEKREPGQRGQLRVVLERAGELVDRAREHQVEKDLNPAGAALLAAVPARRPQRRRADRDVLQRNARQARRMSAKSGQEMAACAPSESRCVRIARVPCA